MWFAYNCYYLYIIFICLFSIEWKRFGEIGERYFMYIHAGELAWDKLTKIRCLWVRAKDSSLQSRFAIAMERNDARATTFDVVRPQTNVLVARSGTKWSPRAPFQNPMDFFLWGPFDIGAVAAQTENIENGADLTTFTRIMNTNEPGTRYMISRALERLEHRLPEQIEKNYRLTKD